MNAHGPLTPDDLGMRETPPGEHAMSLGYTMYDDGVWLSCSCGYEINLGFFVDPYDASAAATAHKEDGRD